MHQFIISLVNFMNRLGYTGITVLMAMESSVLPVPSELVMPPAGYLVQQGKMNMLIVILCGTVGSLIGAYANYFVSLYLGRAVILKYGRYVGITPAKFERAEKFYLRHGEIATFIGRLFPVIRHLISIPAGLYRMNHLRFSLYTLLGAGIWVTILTFLGYLIGANQALIMHHLNTILVILAVACVVLLAAYVFRYNKKRQQS